MRNLTLTGGMVDARNEPMQKRTLVRPVPPTGLVLLSIGSVQVGSAIAKSLSAQSAIVELIYPFSYLPQGLRAIAVGTDQSTGTG
ncbi:MAG: hypothetical protein ACAF41_32995 [Leptolyngbya sp. BL-A-14]